MRMLKMIIPNKISSSVCYWQLLKTLRNSQGMQEMDNETERGWIEWERKKERERDTEIEIKREIHIS